jgi:8-oxo-dGTP pyrophosphatase MutT (NUDIX family)
MHPAGVSEPRPAATVILLRDAPQPGQFELLLVERNPRARFMGGAWVFPGGALSLEDGDGQLGLMRAARRELAEEAGIVLPSTTELVAFDRWITPEGARTRFDTWFYLALADEQAVAKVDGEEIVDAIWIAPARALVRESEGSLLLAFPTIEQLKQLSAFTSAAGLLADARGREVEPVRPRMVGDRILLPGDPGYA